MSFKRLMNDLSLHTNEFINNNKARSLQQIANKLDRSKTFVMKIKNNKLGPCTNYGVLSKVIDVVAPESEKEQLQKELALLYLKKTPKKILEYIKFIHKK